MCTVPYADLSLRGGHSEGPDTTAAGPEQRDEFLSERDAGFYAAGWSNS